MSKEGYVLSLGWESGGMQCTVDVQAQIKTALKLIRQIRFLKYPGQVIS
jgi:hypothetical protein